VPYCGKHREASIGAVSAESLRRVQ
jgi:hypothetical protein